MIKQEAKESIIDVYKKLIDEWYHEYPNFKASQVYNKLLSYGYSGSYNTVKRYTRRYRQKKKPAYHELNFLPGEEAQIDWMVETKLPFGPVYGFVFILSYSRYLYAKFYMRQSFEFFLDGHIEAFREINGIPHSNRYDNCKSVVIKRKPEIIYNAQFLDFARFYGFSIYLCNPRRANEKGRVERVIRDIRAFLNINTFDNLPELNNRFSQWRTEKNLTIHRATNKIPYSGIIGMRKAFIAPKVKFSNHFEQQHFV